VSVWDLAGKKNRFMHKTDEMGLSKFAYKFLGGVVHSADTFAALFIPTINSYKRIDADVTSSGATWSPNAVTYSGNNRTHMIRIPDPGRFELRLMDGAANPYLLQAGVLAAGLDGVVNNRDPGKRLDINMYTDGHKLKRVRKLPANMLDAVRLFDSSEVARAAFGDEFVDSYVKLKMDEWKRFCRSVTPWEREHTLDC
jgi:glutamine synthetase